MKHGRIHSLGGIGYGNNDEALQTTAYVGSDGTYTNQLAPSVSTVGEALDLLLGGTPRYMEVQDTPYLVMRAGDYVCLPGSNTLYLGNGMVPSERVSIMGLAGMWTLRSSTDMRVGDQVGGIISSLEEGSSITLLMTSQGWICTHLLGNIDILPG